MRFPIPSKIDLQGHRGCRGLMPENTIPAMKKALDLGVTTLEMDVVITKDNKVVVSHEPWFNADITSLPDGSFINKEEERKYNIYQMNYDEVRSYDVGLKPHPSFPRQENINAVKPLLNEVFALAENYMKASNRDYPYFNIETKTKPAGDGFFHPGPEEFVELLMEVVHSFNVEDKVIIQSFDFRTLRYLHHHYPAIRTAMLVENNPDSNPDKELMELGFTPDIYSPHFSMLTKELIGDLHKKGMSIITWTVNNKEDIERMKEMGVDGIISDYPDLFY